MRKNTGSGGFAAGARACSGPPCIKDDEDWQSAGREIRRPLERPVIYATDGAGTPDSDGGSSGVPVLLASPTSLLFHRVCSIRAIALRLVDEIEDRRFVASGLSRPERIIRPPSPAS